MKLLDTIAAISTPPGKGGVAMLRVSGADARAIAARVFFPKSGQSLLDIPARTAVYGAIYAPDVGDAVSDTWVPVDDGMATVFCAPASFTGEDTVEITCHGGILLTETVLSALLSAGARMAEAGEFTRRAYLNGKLSLSAAESLGDLLEAQSRGQMALALGGLRGKLAEKIRACYEALRTVLTSVLACIDFPDEDLSEMSREDMLASLRDTKEQLLALGTTYRTGHAVAEGIPTVICGQTNVGKSSLYNALLGRDAAIVTDIAGTTRDVLSETTALGDVTLRLFDTAGLRDTDDTVERIGIERARAAMEEAELILAVFDASRPPSEDERALIDVLRTRAAGDAAVLALLNKTDAVDPRLSDAVRAELQAALGDITLLPLSTKTGAGLDALAAAVKERFIAGDISLREDAVIANARQMAAVRGAIEALSRATEALEIGLPMDLCCEDVTLAMAALSELDGRAIGEEIVGEIFSHFCVGK